MARYAIDAQVALELARGSVSVAPGHALVAPARFRSDAMSTLHRAWRAGEVGDAGARALLDALTTLKVRALNDRVSRATAWRIARDLGWEDTAKAEYLAVASLQADALVALDADILAGAPGVVELAELAALAG